VKLKEGASLEGCSWRMFDAAIKCEPSFNSRGVDLVITAGTDGKHMVGSLHYKGMALDIRTRNIVGNEVEVLAELKTALGPAFDVVLEGDHIHLEYDPKG
jgi:hypothetical protein